MIKEHESIQSVIEYPEIQEHECISCKKSAELRILSVENEWIYYCGRSFLCIQRGVIVSMYYTSKINYYDEEDLTETTRNGGIGRHPRLKI